MPGEHYLGLAVCPRFVLLVIAAHSSTLSFSVSPRSCPHRGVFTFSLIKPCFPLLSCHVGITIIRCKKTTRVGSYGSRRREVVALGAL